MWILNHSPVVLFSKSFDEKASVRSGLDLQLEAITAAEKIKSDGGKGEKKRKSCSKLSPMTGET